MSYTPSEARGQELQWLLTLTIGGTVVRVSDLEAEVDDVATGAVYVYAAGLDGVSPPALALGDLGSAPSASASVSFLWPSADGLADLLALDGDPSDAYGELALWVPGTDYSRRHVVVQGAARISGSGEPHELVDVEISLRLSDDALQRLYFEAKLEGIPPRTLAQRLIDEGLRMQQHPRIGFMNGDRKSTRLNSSHSQQSRMPSSA